MFKHKKSQGFTLIELMVTIAIIGVLSSLAYPSYIRQGLKAKRTEAKTALLDLATREERYFSINNAYTNSGTNLGFSSAFPVNIGSSGGTTYQITVSAATATAFTATATPQGSQTADTCGTFQIASSGVQSNSGNTTATASCW